MRKKRPPPPPPPELLAQLKLLAPAPIALADMRLADIRAEFFHAIAGAGMYCRGCNKWGKVNSVSLTGPLVATLAFLYRRTVPRGEFVHVPSSGRRVELNKNNVGKLALWSFAETARNGDETKKSSGMWRITERGVQFFRGGLRVYWKAWTYNDAVVAFDASKLVDVVDASVRGQKKFDYAAAMADLMRNSPELVPPP